MTTPIKFHGLGIEGLKLATAREGLTPRQAWVMTNVRPYKGKIESTPGITQYNAGAISGTPLFVRAWLNDDGIWRFNIFTNSKLFKIDTVTGVLSDITKVTGDYLGTGFGPADAVVMGDLFIFTNKVDPVQKWDGDAANAVNLGGNPPVCGTICAAMTFLIAANLAGSPRTIQWSDSNDPETWAGGDSGNFTIYQGPGDVLRLMPLGEIVMAYRIDNIHMLYYVGPPYIWAQRQVVTSHGLIAYRAIGDLGNRHLYWGTDNVYLFDGVSRTPVADDVIDAMNVSFDPTYQTQIHCGLDYQDRKAYFFYPAPGDEGLCKNAWVFDYAHGQWHHENYGTEDIAAIGNYRTVGALTWDTAIGTWADQVISWAQALYFLANFPIAIICSSTGHINYFDKTADNILAAGREKIFETGLVDPGEAVFQSPGSFCDLFQVDVDYEKQSPTTLGVSIGTQDILFGDADITWTAYTLALAGATGKVDTRHNARYFALRLRNTLANQPFRVSGVTPWFALRGRR